jgi:hypothetical protein
MKSLSSKTYQCGVTIQGLTTLAGTTYITGITNTASWDHVIVGTTAQGQIYTRTYAQFMGDVVTGINLSSYVPTSRTLTINGTGYDLSADRSWTITTPFVSKLQHTVKAGVAINKGQAVYVTGADGTNMVVGLASNASEATSSKTMGLLDATVSTNGFANVVTEGLLAGLDTSGANAAGDPVWLGTGGNLIYGLVNKPSAPAHLVFIGIVTRKNSNNGEIFVKVQNGFELEELHNVAITSVADRNLLVYESATSLWKNKTLGTVIGGAPSQYVKGDGTLGAFPSIGGGGGVVYYLNGGVASGVGGYQQMSTAPVLGAGTDFSLTGNGLICQFLTDANSPSLTLVPAGAWRIGLYAAMASAANNSKFYIEILKYNGSTFTLIGTSVTTPESVTNGTNIEYYTATVAIASTVLTVTDRIALRIYAVDNNGKTMTIHTENGHLCDISTTFPSGLSSINGLTDPSQLLVVGSSGSDFNITSSVDTHTFNIPTASASNRGLLSAADWTAFNGKLSAESDTLASVTSRGSSTSTPVTFNGNVTLGNSADLVFQDLAGTFPTSGKGFDWTLNNDGARIYAIQPNSDSIDFVFQLRDNATTNDRFVFWVDEWQGPAFDKYPLIISGGTEFDLKDSSLYTNTVLRLSNSGVLQNVTGNISMFTNNVGYLTSYTETDTLSTVTGRGATTNTSITVGPDLTVQADGGVNYTASRLWLNSHNNYRGAGVHMSGTGSTWFAGTPYTDFDGGYVIARTGTSNDHSSAQYSNALLTVKSSGNVGIGTSTPSHNFHIYGTGDRLIKIENSGTYLMYAGLISNEGYIGSTNATPLGFYTNNVNRVYINTSGNVGIGTITPVSKLHVLLNGNTSGGPTGNVASFQNSSAGNNAYISLFGAYNAEAGIIFTDESEQYKGKIGYDNISEYMYFQTDGSEKARITSTGNVGIGVTNPSYKLDVNGSFNFVTSGVNLTYNSGVLYHGNYYQFPSGSYYYLYGRTGMGLIFGSNNAEVGRFDLSGNLGIGTTSPNEKLHVAGNVHAYAAGGIDSGLFASTSAGSTSIAIRSNGVTHFNGGNVGIGTNSPKAKLQVNNGHIAVYHNVSTDGAQIYLGDTNFDNSGYWNSAPGIGSVFSPGTTVAGDLAFYVYTGVSNSRTERMRIIDSGNVGIGTTTPSTKLDVSGVITATGGNSTNWNTAYGWGNHASASYVPQARTLTINGTSYDLSANRSWTIATTTPGGSNTQFQYNSSGSLAGASALTYNSTTNRVGINQASPGYDLDVNGQVRVQDKLRVGTVNSGNGVVHMSSTATINANTTTIVWAQNVSVGMCAFIEYYILNGNTFTDQRAGTIIVTWNQTGTPTIAHTETTTPDIGSTTTINFTSTLVGSDARINAVSSSPHPYTMIMSYKYF